MKGTPWNKMMKAAYVAGLFAIASLHGNIAAARSIKNGDTVLSTNGAEIYIKDEMSRQMTWMAHVKLFNLECSTGDAFRLGTGVEGDYFLPKLASLHAEYIGTYFNVQKLDVDGGNSSQNDIKSFSSINLGGRFHILDRTGKNKHKIVLESHTQYGFGGSSTTTIHYIKGKLPVRRIFAARGGLYRTTAPVTTDMNESELKVGTYGAVKTKDGTILSNAYFTNARTTGIYLGLSDIINMRVRTKNNVSGYKNDVFLSCLFREVFADVILAHTSFDDFKVGGRSLAIEPNAKGSFQTTAIGWRLGQTFCRPRKHMTITYKLEIGNRPGVAGRGLYFSSGVNLTYVHSKN